MNLPQVHTSRFKLLDSPRSGRQSGSAVIIVMALLALILVYVAGNLRALTNLGRELKLLERQQIRRLQHASYRTNAPPVIVIGTNSIPVSGAH